MNRNIFYAALTRHLAAFMLPAVMYHPDPNHHVAARPLAARAGIGVIGTGTQIGARKRAAMPKHMCMCLGIPVAGVRRKGHLQR